MRRQKYNVRGSRRSRTQDWIKAMLTAESLCHIAINGERGRTTFTDAFSAYLSCKYDAFGKCVLCASTGHALKPRCEGLQCGLQDSFQTR